MTDESQSLTIKPKTVHIRWYYGEDNHPGKTGFFWPTSEQKRSEMLEVSRNAPAQFEAVYQCKPGGREGHVFLSDDLNAFFKPPNSLPIGIISPEVKLFTSRAAGTYQAWDTAFSNTADSAHTVGITGLFVPCDKYHCDEDPKVIGECEPHMDVYILDVVRSKLDWGGLVAALRTQYQRWLPDGVIIEKKASGISLIQALAQTTLPIIETTSNESKGSRALNTIGLKSAGSVQGWFRQHRVRVPDNEPLWYAKWRAEMKDFSGKDDTSSDQVDATVHLVTHAIKMGSSMAVLPTDWSPEASSRPATLDADQYSVDNQNPGKLLLDFIGELPSLTNDPFEGTCSHCVSYKFGHCSLFDRSVTSLDSCPEFADRYDQRRQNLQELERDFTSLQH